MKRQTIITLLFAICLMVSLLPISAQASDTWDGKIPTSVTTTWDRGGTISTAEELAQFAYNVNNGKTYNGDYITLTADIVLNEGALGASSHEWIPIGTVDNQFSGNFNGGGHLISGVYIDTTDSLQGLFGYITSDSVVNDVSVSGSITAADFVGGVVGYNNGGEVLNCLSAISVTATDNEARIGGVVGFNASGKVLNCANTKDVTATGDATVIGGVVGDNTGGTVANSYNVGAISSTTDNAFIGGVVGDNSGLVENCYNGGTIDGGNSGNIGGVVGYNQSYSTVENCYWLKTSGASRGTGENSGGTLINIGSFSSSSSVITPTDGAVKPSNISHDSLFAALISGRHAYNIDKNYDHVKKWAISEDINGGYPAFATHWDDYIATTPPSGQGTSASPYLIDDEADLAWVAKEVNDGTEGVDLSGAYFFLVTDLDLSAHVWVPIGTSSNPFTGNFDGDFHLISGLSIDSMEDGTGFFGDVGVGGVVKNVGVSGTVIGRSIVGGVAGDNEGTIANCYNTSSVTSIINSSVGGVVGTNYGTVVNCYNTGALSAIDPYPPIGGIAAKNYGTVNNCYSTGELTFGDSNHVGGVVGYNDDSGTTENCYYQGGNNVSVGVGNNYNGIVTNVGSFDRDTTQIRIDSGVTSTDSITTSNLLDALNAGTVAYNNTNPDIEAKWWDKSESINDGYPIHYVDWSDYASTTPPSGEGTSASPYYIRDEADLAWVAKEVNDGAVGVDLSGAYITLRTDLDLSSREWIPIGTSNNPFTGNFDGDFHLVSGLYIDTQELNQGLFGYVKEGVVEKVGVNGSIIGRGNIGGVVGRNDGGTIANCYNTGTVTITDNHSGAGGVVGYNYGRGTVVNCYNTGTISSTADSAFVGGIVGQNYVSTVNNCYSASDIYQVGSYVGGIVGNNRSNGTVENCYVMTALYDLYGCVGASSTGTITNVGWFLTATSEITIDSGVTSTTSIPTTNLLDALAAGATVYNEDSEVYAWPWWPQFGDSNNYPIHQTRWVDNITTAPTGKGTEEDPYLIKTGSDLAWMAMVVISDYTPARSAHYKLNNDISISEHIWAPIGNSTNSFAGTFDGDGYHISGLYVDTTNDYQGLFGFVGGDYSTNTVIKNVGVSGSVTGGSFVGGLVGLARFTTITNCYNNATVTSTDAYETYTGGLVAHAYNATITNGYNSGKITSNSDDGYVGGIAGEISQSTIQNSYNVGIINGENPSGAGGVLGNDDFSNTLENCYWQSATDLSGIGEMAESGERSTYSNIGVFTSATSTINVILNANSKIPTSNLPNALNTAAIAYNTALRSGQRAYRWEMTQESDYPTITSLEITGDADYDGVVTVSDLKNIAADGVYNTTPTGQSPLDANGDGKINFGDLAMARNSKNFGKTN